MNYSLRPFVELRHLLHQNPELSSQEVQTAKIITDFLTSYEPDEVYHQFSKTSVLFKFNGQINHRNILFRCELDALPIQEQEKKYQSNKSGISHMCGHDGHMSILCSLAPFLKKNKERPNVYLLFQHAEETGQGAKEVINSSLFQNLSLDYVFALHNYPSRELSHLFIKEKTMACASTGLKVKIQGESSHAGEINFKSPIKVIEKLLSLIKKTNEQDSSFFQMVTLTHLSLGEENFGINPGQAHLCLTLRADEQSAFENLKQTYSSFFEHFIQFEITKEWVEEFPVTANPINLSQKIIPLLQQRGFIVHQVDKAFPWSEDFGHFLNKWPGLFFVLGSGVERKPLHDSGYDFPDELIEHGNKLFISLINLLSNEENN